MSAAARTRCVLFDLDGTLIDTAPDLGYAANCLREEAGLPPLPEADYRPLASAGARGLLRLALDIGPGDEGYLAQRDRFLDHYERNLTRTSRPFPGVAALLERIESRGQTWGVVTNKASVYTRPLMDALGLSQRAACVISADEVPKPKPAPDGLLRALDLVGLENDQAIYVGDDLRDIQAARAAGLYSVGAGWGYLGQGEAIENWGADLVLRDVASLEQWLYGV
jgi:phosphoglycolate phosphatase